MLNTFIKTIIILIFLFCQTAWAVSIDQVFINRALKWNRYFLDFINISASNFGQENQILEFQKAIQHDFNARLWALKNDYDRSHKEIRKSQNVLKNLFYDILGNRYIEDTERLLNISVSVILKAQDKNAERYLKLGYRELTIARKYLTIGYNMNRFLFFNKIRYYLDGIKKSRRGKKLAFLALIESKTPMEEKSEYKSQTFEETYIEKNVEKVSEYNKIKDTIANLMSQDFLEKELVEGSSFFLHHADNYSIIAEDKKSVQLESIETLSTEMMNLKEKQSISPDNSENGSDDPQFEDEPRPSDTTGGQ